MKAVNFATRIMCLVTVIFFSMMTTHAASAQSNELQVIVKPAVVFRSSPDLKGKIIGKIPFAKSVVVVDREGPEANLMGVTGKWTKVSYSGKTGWVFGVFLDSPESQKFFQILDGIAYAGQTSACLQMPMKYFPKFFNGGCLRQECNQMCGNVTLEENGGVHSVPGCDGNTPESRGKWKRQGNDVVIEYTIPGMSAADICAYRVDDPKCIAEAEKSNFKKCGKKNGCDEKVKQVLRMSADNQFTLNGESVCVYP